MLIYIIVDFFVFIFFKIVLYSFLYLFMLVGGVLDIVESFIFYMFKNILNVEVYIEDLIFMGIEECGKYRF